MATIHNQASRGEIAKTVLMPGDPKRAAFIAEKYLEDVKLLNELRCAYCYTGRYNGKPVSVMASGMGAGSMGIYSYELFTEYDVDQIIRVGSAGGLHPDLKLGDIVLAEAVSSDQHFDSEFQLPGQFSPCASFDLLKRADAYCESHGINCKVGSVFSGIKFHYSEGYFTQWTRLGILAVEMEAAALYTNAAQTGKKALTMCTISDLLLTHEALSGEARETTFSNMIEVALSLV